MIAGILIEGIDGAGKSTLAKELSNRLGWDSMKLGHKDGSQFDRYLIAYATAHNLVIERGHLSELVYSEIFGRTIPFKGRQCEILKQILAERFLVIWANPLERTAIQRCARRDSHTLQVVDNNAIRSGRKYFMQQVSRLRSENVFEYRSADLDELENLLQRVKQRLSR